MDATSERLKAIESAVALLQHDHDQFHELLLSLQKELRLLSLRLERAERSLSEHQEPPEVRSPEAERPPHY